MSEIPEMVERAAAALVEGGAADIYPFDGCRTLARAVIEATPLARYRNVLTNMAALDDEGANAVLAATGSYSSFDEPYAVQAAREALAK